MKPAATGGPSLLSNSNRRQPQRSVRSTASRPSNYYARPFGFRVAPNAAVEPPTLADAAPGFFPAITHFTDGITALPKEVIRHLTMLRETEGKAYPHEQAIDELVDAINDLPAPPRATQPQTQAFLNFSLGNSVNVSANVSVIDGNTSRPLTATDEQLPSSQTALDEPAEKRRHLFYQLRTQLQQMIHVLDEKNHVLTTANDTLARQLSRLDGTIPHIETEISEEARLGSNTHWALPHMKELRKAAAPPQVERSRRDVQAANNLAAAAAAVHEGDIAATRSEARREAMLAKRTRHNNVDSDFDDRTTAKKTQSYKVRKVQEVAVESAKTAGAGGAPQSHKRRRIEKVAAPALERSASALNGRLAAGRDLASPRETPAVEVAKKRAAKPLLAPAASRKRYGRGLEYSLKHANSCIRPPVDPPLIATSSPKRGTFATLHKEFKHVQTVGEILEAHAHARRNAINSAVQENTRGRPAAKAKTTNGRVVASPEKIVSVVEEKADNMEQVEAAGEAIEEGVVLSEEARASELKREDTEPAEPALMIEVRPLSTPLLTSVPMTATRSRGGSNKASKPGTPVKTGFGDVNIPTTATTAPMSRSRSTRGAANGSGSNSSNSNHPAASSPAPTTMAAPAAKRSHKKGASGRNASVTASSAPAPSPAPQDSKTPAPADAVASDAIPARKTRGGTTKNLQPIPTTETGDHPSLISDEDDDDRLSSVKGEPLATITATTTAAVAASADEAANDETIDDDDERPVDAEVEAGVEADVDPDLDADADADAEADVDPDAEADEDEPRYCVCGGVSYGDMIACDNEACPREWFHLQCVGLSKAPASKVKWFCPGCRKSEMGGGGDGIGVGVGGGSGSGSGGGGSGNVSASGNGNGNGNSNGRGGRVGGGGVGGGR